MNNKLPNIIIAIFGFILAAHLGAQSAFAAPTVLFSPTTQTVAIDNTFDVTITINTESNSVMGSDVTVLYAGADLEVTARSNGGFFPEFTSANNPAGRLELHAYTSAQFDSRTGSGTYARITFKSKKGVGTSAIAFACSQSGTDTNIVSTAGENIMSCTSVNQIGVTYTGAGTTITPTPTTPAGSTPTPTSSAGGNTSPYCSTLTSNLLNAVGTPQTVTLTCAGVDPDGDVFVTEFTFGDGTNQTIERNVGRNGSLSTTHTYTTIGTLGASCKVRDDDGAWSSPAESCKKIITIRPSPSPTPKKTGSSLVSTGQIPEIVQIIEETPEPTTTPEPITTLFPDEEDLTEETGGSRFWWIVGGAAALILAFTLLRKRKGPPGPPTTSATPDSSSTNVPPPTPPPSQI